MHGWIAPGTGQNIKANIVQKKGDRSMPSPVQVEYLPYNLLYKAHQIPKLKCFLYPHAVVFAQSIEARC